MTHGIDGDPLEGGEITASRGAAGAAWPTLAPRHHPIPGGAGGSRADHLVNDSWIA
jgi:hypothetical protein